jgi:starch phosphorylase
MSKDERVGYPIGPHQGAKVEGFDSLAELALNMRWSWNHATDEVWRRLEPELWKTTHNPWVVLQTASRDQIERVMADPAFRKNIDPLVKTPSSLA